MSGSGRSASWNGRHGLDAWMTPTETDGSTRYFAHSGPTMAESLYATVRSDCVHTCQWPRPLGIFWLSVCSIA